jgi:hypothetical protein
LAQGGDDFGGLGEAAVAVLGEDELAVGDDVEDAVIALEELRLDAERLPDVGRQTGGPRQIVSAYAVLDGDVHRHASMGRVALGVNQPQPRRHDAVLDHASAAHCKVHAVGNAGTLTRGRGPSGMRAWMAALLMLAVPVAAAPIDWQESVEVAAGAGERGPWRQNESRYAYVDDPAVAIDERGAVAAVWVDQGRKVVLFQRFSPQGAPLGQPVDVSRSPDIFSWLPRVALGADGEVFVLWQEIIFSGGSHGGDILFARSRDGGETFSAPLNLSRSVGGAGKGRVDRDFWHNGSLDLAPAEDGMLYVAWTEYEGGLYLSRSQDRGASFSAPARIAGTDREPARAPSLAAGTDGELYVAWTIGEDMAADIRVARSTDGGRSFDAPRLAERTVGYADAPKIALGADGTLHLVYSQSAAGPLELHHVRYARSADRGRSFTPGRDISGSGAGFPALGLDDAGNLYVLWERLPGPRMRPRGLGIVAGGEEGFSPPAKVPGSEGAGVNGGMQGLLMQKLAVNGAGQLVVANSTFVPDKASRVWLMRGARR